MRNLIYIFSFITTFGFAKPIDTISSWTFYYNNKKVKTFNIYDSKPKITINLDTVKSLDSIKIKYYNDHPCNKCKTAIAILENEILVVDKENNRDRQPFLFAMKDLISKQSKRKKRIFRVLYYSNGYRQAKPSETLFEIEII
jgi:hypothetical protein